MQILSSTQRTGGVETMIMNAYRHIDREFVQFDFLSHLQGPRDFDEEMRSMGARVFETPLITQAGYRTYCSALAELLKRNGPYHAVHTHLDSSGWVQARTAGQSGVKIRVCHAHLDHSFDRSARTRLRLAFARRFAPVFATDLCACSESAARSVFGAATLKKGIVNIIHNGIDTSRYTLPATDALRENIRNAIGAAGRRVILHVARLSAEKNHDFVLEMAAIAKDRGLPWLFACIGDGPRLAEMQVRRDKAGLANFVQFLGSRNDVPDLMKIADAMVLPSLMEGLPVVLVEAHAAGLPMAVSQAVKKESDLGLGLMRFLPLEAGAAAWVDGILALMALPRCSAAECAAQVEARGFSVKRTAEQLCRLYRLRA